MPLALRLGALTTITCALGTAARCAHAHALHNGIRGRGKGWSQAGRQWGHTRMVTHSHPPVPQPHRPGRGNYYRKSRQPAQPLVFWGYEMSPFVKLAREVRASDPMIPQSRTA